MAFIRVNRKRIWIKKKQKFVICRSLNLSSTSRTSIVDWMGATWKKWTRRVCSGSCRNAFHEDFFNCWQMLTFQHRISRNAQHWFLCFVETFNIGYMLRRNIQRSLFLFNPLRSSVASRISLQTVALLRSSKPNEGTLMFQLNKGFFNTLKWRKTKGETKK